MDTPAAPAWFTDAIATVPDAGHLIALERPDATAELLGPWLERVSA